MRFELLQNFHKTWETDSWRPKTKPCVQQEKGAVSPQETEPDLPVRVQESPTEAWLSSGLLQGWGTEYNSPVKSLLKEAGITTITPTIVWPQT